MTEWRPLGWLFRLTGMHARTCIMQRVVSRALNSMAETANADGGSASTLTSSEATGLSSICRLPYLLGGYLWAGSSDEAAPTDADATLVEQGISLAPSGFWGGSLGDEGGALMSVDSALNSAEWQTLEQLSSSADDLGEWGTTGTTTSPRTSQGQ